MPMIVPEHVTEDLFVAHSATDGAIVHVPFFSQTISADWWQWVKLPAQMEIVKTFDRPVHVWQMLNTKVTQFQYAAMGEANIRITCQRQGSSIRRSYEYPVQFPIAYDNNGDPYAQIVLGSAALFWKWGDGADNGEPLQPGTYTFGAEIMGEPAGFLWDFPEWSDWVSDLWHSIMIFKA